MLAYCNILQRHWCKIRTNNPLAPVIQEIRGRTEVVCAFPDGPAPMLSTARLRHIAGTQWGLQKYMNERRIGFWASLDPQDFGYLALDEPTYA